ncbi:Solute carrier family 22 member 1-like 2 [Homarus americanus]|uniref:Solute carrier family 22 member 1-like 2 n=1 Tax=Homarus americanus TaxID=6706 RepID=A0A8J5JPA5_HOMAM|nr:Solute carrier family 22 member 1-like 2 [Homarus americanus]
MGKKFDELLTHLGTGRWNIFYMVTLSYSYLLPSYHALGGAFLAPIVSYTCLPPAHALTSDQIIIPTTATLNSTTKHGRKNLIVIGSALFTVLAIGSCWANNIHVLLLARFLLGMLQPSFTQSSYTLIMEVLEPTSRSQGGLVITMPWSLGLVTWGGFAYLMRDWRMLQLTASLTCLPFFLVFLFIDESPRWLAVQGRYEEALLVLQKAARWNKVSLPPTPHVLQCLKEERCSQVGQCVEGSSGGGIDWLEVTLVMLGKMAVNAAFTVIIYFTTELFPTEVRVRGLGTSLMVSRIATMLAPIIVEYLVLVYSRLPSVVFGTATLVTGLVTFNLPETLGVALSDTISHLEKEHQQRVDDELKKPEI